tara:strand:- start:719 stop:1105 length:387 start_codon:yes stop_codon:yes gene_type:complete
MNNKKNPLSPHIQIYSWHISSLISISHRITVVTNIIILTLVCIWISTMLLGAENYNFIKFFLESFVGKFLIIGATWSFSFQILSEIRHLFLDFGYGFELKTSNITGIIVIFGSFLLTAIIYLLRGQII